MKRQYLWVWGLVLLVLAVNVKPITGNALPNAIGGDLANLVIAALFWLGIGIIVIGLLDNRRQAKLLNKKRASK